MRKCIVRNFSASVTMSEEFVKSCFEKSKRNVDSDITIN